MMMSALMLQRAFFSKLSFIERLLNVTVEIGGDGGSSSESYIFETGIIFSNSSIKHDCVVWNIVI